MKFRICTKSKSFLDNEEIVNKGPIIDTSKERIEELVEEIRKMGYEKVWVEDVADQT